MTLSPVFRSESALALLREEGIWQRLEPAILAQVRAVHRIHGDLRELVDPRFLDEAPDLPTPASVQDPESLPFLQEYFFLVLFRSLFDSLGVEEDRLDLYTELDFCIKGTITAADNLFDDQAKSLLPLRISAGSRFLSILQLMCFERLIRRVLDRRVHQGGATAEDRDAVLRGLLDRMAGIGELEGSEEGGVVEIPTPEEMVERVHRVRGGALFTLAFVAPLRLEKGRTRELLSRAEPAVSRLGTAFQIVDDLTDFEFDLTRRSHNLLVAQIHHRGSDAEREVLKGLLEGEVPETGLVEDVFRSSARSVLERAYEEARGSFRTLEGLGFWFPPTLADHVVHAIVGLDGTARMEELVTARS